MSISRAEVEKVALLSRLLLTPEELDEMTVHLGSILDYMAQLGEVDTASVATDNLNALAAAKDLSTFCREDHVQPSLTRDEALANAPHRDDECYLVPAVLGET
jgi:aspartyl-tRNA(Asn)/glutamyl-tRNA(Gln) amidotransferase subunit C